MRAELVHRLVIPIAACCWVAAAVLAASFLSWWLALLLVLVVLALSPAALRGQRRRLRLRRVADGVSSAGWAELLDCSTDRGTPLPRDRSVRETAGLFSTAHELDETGQAGLWVVVEALERDWYAPEGNANSAQDTLYLAMSSVLDALGPAKLRHRCWPRSVTGSRARVQRAPSIGKERSAPG